MFKIEYGDSSPDNNSRSNFGLEKHAYIYQTHSSNIHFSVFL